jgi:hypothetical protein
VLIRVGRSPFRVRLGGDHDSGAAMARPCAGACPLAHGQALPHSGAAAIRRRWLSCSTRSACQVWKT